MSDEFSVKSEECKVAAAAGEISPRGRMSALGRNDNMKSWIDHNNYEL